MPTEKAIQDLMNDTGMGRVQAYHYLFARAQLSRYKQERLLIV